MRQNWQCRRALVRHRLRAAKASLDRMSARASARGGAAPLAERDRHGGKGQSDCCAVLPLEKHMPGHDTTPVSDDSQIAGDVAEDMGGFEDMEGIDELMLLDGGDSLPLSEIDYQ